jgi:hypothetical protein
MTRTIAAASAALALTLGAVASPPAATAQSTPIEVGAVAPDFTLPGATRHGILAEPVSLSDYEGKTVVLAFFFRARSRG